MKFRILGYFPPSFPPLSSLILPFSNSFQGNSTQCRKLAHSAVSRVTNIQLLICRGLKSEGTKDHHGNRSCINCVTLSSLWERVEKQKFTITHDALFAHYVITPKNRRITPLRQKNGLITHYALFDHYALRQNKSANYALRQKKRSNYALRQKKRPDYALRQTITPPSKFLTGFLISN